MSAIFQSLTWLFGPDGKPAELTVWQMSARGILIFIVGLALMRFSDRRSLAQRTAFDSVFIVLIGAVLARTINGSGPLFASCGAALVLMLLHRSCALLACHHHLFGKLIKGREVVLVRNGQMDERAMNRNLVSKHDVLEDLRLGQNSENLSDIALARLERSGSISFLK